MESISCISSIPPTDLEEDSEDEATTVLENVDRLDSDLSGGEGDDDDIPPLIDDPSPLLPLPQPEPRRSGRTHRSPIPDDDPRYNVTSYGRKPKPASVGANEVNVAQTKYKEPTTYEEAMAGPDAPLWKAACAEELVSFVKTELYDEVEHPRGRKVVDCKWVFKVKRGPDGEITRYKARLVARGFTQVAGINYTETFAPVAKFTSIRMLLALAARDDLELHQMDVKTAFLNGDLDEEIYMHLPPGFRKANVVWKLKKGLYGLKQASRQWYNKIRTEFEKLGFKRCHSDHGIFYRSANGIRIIIAIYVDDLLLFSDSLKAIKNVKFELNKRFEMTDLGEARWILGMEVKRDRKKRTLNISQRQYVMDILERHGMADCRSVSTPMVPNLSLMKLSAPEMDVTTYQSAVGSLMYAMIGTRPDLAHAVGVLSQFAANPGTEHWNALKRVFRYLRGTQDMSLVFGSGNTKLLTGYADADWAADKNDRRSLTGYVFLMSGGAISWSSRKQHSTAQSSTEAEYMAGAHAAKEAAWIRIFLSEIGEAQSSPTHLMMDNQSAMALAKNPEFHSRTKHIDVHYHFLREKIAEEDLALDFIPTGEQIADVLTKGLPKQKFEVFVSGMGLRHDFEDAS